MAGLMSKICVATFLLHAAAVGAQASASKSEPQAKPRIRIVAPASTPSAVTPDGGKYFGPLVDGKLHGNGIIVWANGARYEGGFEKGLLSGKGKYQSPSFDYEGDFKDGLMHGQGRQVESNGDVYEGAFANGSFEGRGKWTGSGEEYRGEFKNGKYAGQGELKYADSRKYSGSFADGSFQGKGRYETPDKEIYEGNFVKGEFEGQGNYQTADGARHVGSFRKWRPHGPGIYTDARGTVYEGSFNDGELIGKGKQTSKDGRRYEGEFKNWKYHGQGIFRYPNGDEYTGGFAYGLFEGKGVFVYAKPKPDGRSKDVGTWRFGSLENKEKAQQAAVIAETALYNQRALLDKTLSAIAPRESGKINLYLLAVGGDGAQEVFRREVDYVRNQFDRDFGTKGRSIALINSRNTVAEMPMATLTSIRESISAIAGRMDKENDILFLFLTSHGSKDHKFVLDQNGMNLRSLEAKELGKILKESGIRWKVVVVSACYAGGFIDPVKDERTMVIAAARHDRTSFGCADENDFTYFGRAFFKESLPESKSFQDAFQKAKALVAKWEMDDFKKTGDEKIGDDAHSEPQIHQAGPIEQHLEKWRAQLAVPGKKK
jgi:hypothetical protein